MPGEPWQVVGGSTGNYVLWPETEAACIGRGIGYTMHDMTQEKMAVIKL